MNDVAVVVILFVAFVVMVGMLRRKQYLKAWGKLWFISFGIEARDGDTDVTSRNNLS